MKIAILLLIVLVNFGCSSVVRPDLEIEEPDFSLFSPAVDSSVYEVIWTENVGVHFENDPRVELKLEEPMPFGDVLSLLSSLSGVSIVANVGSQSAIGVAISYSGPISGLLDILCRDQNVYWSFDGNAISVYSFRIIELSFPGYADPQSLVSLENGLAGLGGKVLRFGNKMRVEVSPSASRLIREFIQGYSLDIVTTNFELLQYSSSYARAIGVDPDRLQAIVTGTVDQARALAMSSAVGGFSISAQSPTLSLTAVVRAVADRAGYTVSDRVTVSALSGAESSVVLGTRYPYVSSVTLATLGSNGSAGDTPVQSFDFAEAVDGLSLSVRPFFGSGSVRLAGNLSVSKVLEFMTVGSGNSSISRPVSDQKDIAFDVLARAGEPYLLCVFSSRSAKRASDLGSADWEDKTTHYAVIARSTVQTAKVIFKTSP